ncbi:MAG: DUF134 domain-containing protein [Bacillota bacterium]
MPRPRKWKRVCQMPGFQTYGPMGKSFDDASVVAMTVEEFETIRLIDLEGMDQEHCAEKMGVARSTIQRLYNDARQKIADVLVNGKALKIEGGDYRICEEFSEESLPKCRPCGRKGYRHGKGSGHGRI